MAKGELVFPCASPDRLNDCGFHNLLYPPFPDGPSGPPPLVYDPDYQAILNYATLQGYALPSTLNKTHGNQLVIDFKTLGIWNELDVLYIFKTDGDRNFAKINWKAPGTFQATELVAPTFLVSDGFKGDGVGQYLNTNWAPLTNGVKYILGSASAFIDFDNVAPTKYMFGSINGNNQLVLGRQANNDMILNVNNLGGWGNFYTVANKFLQGQSANGFSAFTGVFLNGAYTTGSSNAGAGGVPSGVVYLLASNTGGVVTLPTPNTIRMWGAGSGLYGKELALYNAWANYKNNTTLLEFPLDIEIGTDGVAKGYNAIAVYGALMSYPFVNGEQILAVYSMPDDTLHVTFVGNAQLDGVQRITLETPGGAQATLDWDGMEYVGPAPVIAVTFIVFTTVTLKMII